MKARHWINDGLSPFWDRWFIMVCADGTNPPWADGRVSRCLIYESPSLNKWWAFSILGYVENIGVASLCRPPSRRSSRHSHQPPIYGAWSRPQRRTRLHSLSRLIYESLSLKKICHPARSQCSRQLSSELHWAGAGVSFRSTHWVVSFSGIGENIYSASISSCSPVLYVMYHRCALQIQAVDLFLATQEGS